MARQEKTLPYFLVGVPRGHPGIYFSFFNYHSDIHHNPCQFGLFSFTDCFCVAIDDLDRGMAPKEFSMPKLPSTVLFRSVVWQPVCQKVHALRLTERGKFELMGGAAPAAASTYQDEVGDRELIKGGRPSGCNLAKNGFPICGDDEARKVLVRKQLRRTEAAGGDFGILTQARRWRDRPGSRQHMPLQMDGKLTRRCRGVGRGIRAGSGGDRVIESTH
jgi:hypothetical protein